MKKLSLFLLFILIVFSRDGFPQNNIVFKGMTLDDSTGMPLVPKIYISVLSKKMLIENSGSNDKIEFAISPQADSLFIEKEGYQTLVFPLNFHGDFTKKSVVSYSFELNKSGKNNKYKSILIYTFPENHKAIFMVDHFILDSLHCTNPLNMNILDISTNIELAKLQPNNYYQVLISQKDSTLIRNNKFRILSGINFVDLNPNNILLTKTDINTIDIFETYSFVEVNFDQSKYDLTDSTKKTLEGVSQYYIKNKPFSKIIVKGFTDGVGDKMLNSNLSQYRAKAVKNFLVKNGMNEDYILIEWEKQNHNVENPKPNELSKYRKVEIYEKL
jgi:outer membrane protein OmpA-like peptidoglycan-associated protein